MIPFDIWIRCVKYIPLHRWNTFGSETQTAELILPNRVSVIEYTHIPWSIFKTMDIWYVMDLILPADYPNVTLFNGEMTYDYYTDEGYGLPTFKNLDDLYRFNEFYKNSHGESKENTNH